MVTNTQLPNMEKHDDGQVSGRLKRKKITSKCITQRIDVCEGSIDHSRTTSTVGPFDDEYNLDDHEGHASDATTYVVPSAKQQQRHYNMLLSKADRESIFQSKTGQCIESDEDEIPEEITSSTKPKTSESNIDARKYVNFSQIYDPFQESQIKLCNPNTEKDSDTYTLECGSSGYDNSEPSSLYCHMSPSVISDTLTEGRIKGDGDGVISYVKTEGQRRLPLDRDLNRPSNISSRVSSSSITGYAASEDDPFKEQRLKGYHSQLDAHCRPTGTSNTAEKQVSRDSNEKVRSRGRRKMSGTKSGTEKADTINNNDRIPRSTAGFNTAEKHVIRDSDGFRFSGRENMPGTKNGTEKAGTRNNDDRIPCSDLRIKKSTENFKNYLRNKEPYISNQEERIFPISMLQSLVEIENTSTACQLQFKEVENFQEFRFCTDIKLLHDYYILSVKDMIIKKCRDSERKLDTLKLRNAGRMCCIKKSTRIAVIQTAIGIVCLETNPKLEIVYTVKTSQLQYMSICHLDTYTPNGNQNDLPNPYYVFAMTGTVRRQDTGQWDECILKAQPKRNRFQTRNQYDEVSSKLDILALSGICSVHTVWRGGIHLIVGCKDRVACVRYTDKSIKWSIPLRHAATDVHLLGLNILVCVQDECKLFACDYEDGSITNDNILASTEDRTRMPHKISVCGDSVLLKFYSNHYWSKLLVVEHSQKENKVSSRREHTILHD